MFKNSTLQNINLLKCWKQIKRKTKKNEMRRNINIENHFLFRFMLLLVRSLKLFFFLFICLAKELIINLCFYLRNNFHLKFSFFRANLLITIFSQFLGKFFGPHKFSSIFPFITISFSALQIFFKLRIFFHIHYFILYNTI